MDLKPMTALRSVTAALACTALLTGCGGGSDDKPSNRADAYGTPAASASGPDAVKARVAAAAPLGQEGPKATADSGPTYKPTGKIVADSGFRPEVNGFSFANYGNEEQPTNLRPQDVEQLFGSQVCERGEGADCTLIPTAQKWLDAQNEGMAGGHCMGFSVASLRMFAKKLDAKTFGNPVVNDLELAGNDDLQGEIAESFVYQTTLADKTIRATPADMLDKLIEVLNDGDDFYTLGIYKADLSDGHAITPLAIEDKGNGKYVVMVYDNNYPSVTRPLYIDKKANTFSYSGASNPAEDQAPYEGGADTNNLDLTPTLIGDKQQPCPFCNGEGGSGEDGKGSAKGTLLPAGDRFTELTLSGDPKNHPHIVLTDTKARQTGIIDGKLVEDIPGVRLVRQFASEGRGVPEPKFQIPAKTTLAISIVGDDLEKRSLHNTLDYSGNGSVVEVDDIAIDPGQTDNVYVDAAGYGFSYEFNSKHSFDPPLIYAGVTTDDASYTFAATAAGLKKGSTINMIVNQKEKVFDFDTSEIKGDLGGKAVVGLVVNRSDADGDTTWVNDHLQVTGTDKQEQILDYGNDVKANKKDIDLLVTSPKYEDRTITLHKQK